MPEKTGKQIQIKELTATGLQAKLDNGVSVWISFNNNEIHLSFSGYDYDKGLSVRELDMMGVKVNDESVKMGNNFTIQYEPNPHNQ